MTKDLTIESYSFRDGDLVVHVVEAGDREHFPRDVGEKLLDLDPILAEPQRAPVHVQVAADRIARIEFQDLPAQGKNKVVNTIITAHQIERKGQLMC
jgi:hypothetical protein